jgi:ribonuclease Z
MKVTILGNNSSLPAFGRHPTAQVVHVNEEPILLDCGEATQIQMQKHGVRWRNLNHIFISHLHGDHYFGLPGIINSMSLLGRTAPLHLFAHAALEPILTQILDAAGTILSYPLHFHPLPKSSEKLVENERFIITCFPTEHRIDCMGFVIEQQKKARKILPEKCEKYNIPTSFYERLKKGENYKNKDGGIVPNDQVTAPPAPPKRYAYCADTTYTETILPYINGVDLLYHESTYLEKDVEKATARFHCTAKQAATMAAKANAKKLLLGHFSSKYKELDEFEQEASPIFPNVVISKEGASYEV